MTKSELFLILERENLSKYLMPKYEEDGVFFLNDDGVGVAFECLPTIGVGHQVESGLRTFLSSVPEGASVQFIFWGGSDIYNLVDYWYYNKVSNVNGVKGLRTDMLLDVIKGYREFLDLKRKEKLSDTFVCTLKNFRLFITVKLGGKDTESSMFDGFLRLLGIKKDSPVETLEERVKKIVGVREKLRGALDGAFLRPEMMDGEALHRVMYKMVNPSKDWREVPDWDRSIPISRSCVHSNSKVEVYENYVVVDGVYVRALSVKTYPEEFSHADVLYYLGDPFLASSYDFDYMIVLNAIKLPEREKGKVKRDATIVLSQQFPYALVPRLKFKHQDLSYAMERIERGADLWLMDFVVLVMSDSLEKLELRTSRVKSEFRRLGFILEENKYINLADFLSCLPFGFDMRMASFLSRQRVRAVFEENVASLAPVYSGWKGTRPEILFVSLTGQLVGFDLFSNPAGGYNSFVVGTTGAGKSVFLQYLTLNYLASGNRVWIIDIGGSYRGICEILGGDYIELSTENPFSINPFSTIKDSTMLEDYMEFLISLFYVMGASKEERRADEDEKLIKALLEETIRESYYRYGRETCVDYLVDYMRKYSSDMRVSDFIMHLKPYTTKGRYGAFFNGESKLYFDKFLTVFENGKIETMKDLRDPAIMILIYHITKDIYLQQANYRHVVLIDEAHKFLGNERIDAFIEQAYRRFRKHGASIILGSQSFYDFANKEVGRIVIENSFWKFFMMQTSTSISSLRESRKLVLTDWEWELMRSVKPKDHEYGETMIVSEVGSAKLRVVLNDFMKALFFTDPETRRRISELLGEGKSYLDAVKTLMEERRREVV